MMCNFNMTIPSHYKVDWFEIFLHVIRIGNVGIDEMDENTKNELLDVYNEGFRINQYADHMASEIDVFDKPNLYVYLKDTGLALLDSKEETYEGRARVLTNKKAQNNQ